MNIFGKIEGPVLGDYIRIDHTYNIALVELLLAQQAKKSLQEANWLSQPIIIFKGHDGDGEYMGWRTGRDNSLEIIAEHIV